MKYSTTAILRSREMLMAFLLSASILSHAGETGTTGKKPVINESNLRFLRELTSDVIDSSRIYPGQVIAANIGPNNTGGVLIRPGGRDCYPSFWIRDYSMSLETGLITPDEQKHMLLLTASTQCDQPWITRGGSLVPYGAIADHIRIDDGLPVYFPGTLDYDDQGNKIFGMVPPYDDQYFFVHMAWYYVTTTHDTSVLSKKIKGTPLICRLVNAYNLPPSRQDNGIVVTSDDFRGVDFGFRDVITMTGGLCMTSILKYRSACELKEIFELTGNKDISEKYSETAAKLKKAIPLTFMDERGMLHASTGKSSQADVWSTALAVWFHVLEGDEMKKTSRFLADAYENGYLSNKGNIRHVLTIDDFDNTTSWEFSLAAKNTYQNGAYWGTPTGWVCYAIALTDTELAGKLADEYIEDLKKNDFRLGGGKGAPYECFHPSGFIQNPVYMTTVTCPFVVFSSMNN
jgi:hypothetical protein